MANHLVTHPHAVEGPHAATHHLGAADAAKIVQRLGLASCLRGMAARI